jgi:osmotically-inducible protein OsmY
MQNKLRQLIISALMRNETTRDLPVHITLQGCDLVLTGQVPTPDHATEVIQTVEAVSTVLKIQNRLVIIEGHYASVH